MESSTEVSWVSVHMGIKVSWAHRSSKRNAMLFGSRIMAWCSSRSQKLGKESWEWSFQEQHWNFTHLTLLRSPKSSPKACCRCPCPNQPLPWGQGCCLVLCWGRNYIFWWQPHPGLALIFYQPHGTLEKWSTFPISTLSSWANTLVSCMGGDYYGLSPFPLQRNVLPMLLPFTDSWFTVFPWDEACLSALPSLLPSH